MIDAVKAIRLTAMADDQHRQRHPKSVEGCRYCEFLDTKVCEHCGKSPCVAHVETSVAEKGREASEE